MTPRKKRVVATGLSAAAVSGLAALLFIAPYFQGLRLQTKLRRAIVGVDRALEPALGIRLLDYRRGYFASRMRLRLTTVALEPTAGHDAVVEVVHGPLPTMEIITGRSSVKFFEASLRAEFTPDVANRAVREALDREGGALARLEGVLGFDDSFRGVIRSPAIRVPKGGLDFAGARARIEARRRSGSVEIRCGKLSMSDVEGDTAIELDGMRARLDVDAGDATTRATATLPGLRLRGADLRLAIKGLQADALLHHGPDTPPRSREFVNLDAASLSVRAGGRDHALTRVSLKQTKRRRGRSEELRIAGSVDRWIDARIPYGPVDAALTVGGLDETSFSQVARTARTLAWNGGAWTDGNERLGEIELANLHRELARKKSRLELLLTLRKGSGEATVRLRLLPMPNRAASANLPGETALLYEGTADLQVTARLLKHLLARGLAGAPATPPGSANRAGGRKRFAVEKILQVLRETGLYVPRRNLYRARFSLAHGDLTVNGQPLDRAWMARLYDIITAFDRPRVAVRMGAPRVDGGLREEQVLSALAGSVDEIEECVQSGIERTGEHPQGAIRVHWIISREGRTRSPAIAMTTANDESLEACIVAVFDGMRFPAAAKRTRAVMAVEFGVREESDEYAGPAPDGREDVQPPSARQPLPDFLRVFTRDKDR
jgi:hypothetical protein